MRVFFFFFFFLSLTNKSNPTELDRTDVTADQVSRSVDRFRQTTRTTTIFNLIKQRTKICVSSIDRISTCVNRSISEVFVLVQRSNWTRSVFFSFFLRSVRDRRAGENKKNEREGEWEWGKKQPAPSSQRVRTSRAFFPLLSVRHDETRRRENSSLLIFLIEWQLRVFSNARCSRTKRRQHRLNYNIIVSRWRMINDKHGE